MLFLQKATITRSLHIFICLYLCFIFSSPSSSFRFVAAMPPEVAKEFNVRLEIANQVHRKIAVGGPGGIRFQDPHFQNGRIARIHVRHAFYIDGIQTFWKSFQPGAPTQLPQQAGGFVGVFGGVSVGGSRDSPLLEGKLWGGMGGTLSVIDVPPNAYLTQLDVCATSQYVQAIRFGFSNGVKTEWFGGVGTWIQQTKTDADLGEIFINDPPTPSPIEPSPYEDEMPQSSEEQPPPKCFVVSYNHQGDEIKGFWGRAGQIIDALGMISSNPSLFEQPVSKLQQQQQIVQPHPALLGVPDYDTNTEKAWEKMRIKLMRHEPNWRRHILRVSSFNLRYDNPEDRKFPQWSWSSRVTVIAEMIRYHKMDVIGVQEGLRSQLNELSSKLGPEYSWVGVGRTDGADLGEFAAIFYRTSRISLVRNDTIWLSQTPREVGSRGWDAALERIMSWAEFRDLRNSRNFLFFNTHFDHEGTECMVQSGLLVLKTISSEIARIGKNTPAFLTGDFNSDATSHAYKIITGLCEDWETHYEITDPNWVKDDVFTDNTLPVLDDEYATDDEDSTNSGYNSDVADDEETQEIEATRIAAREALIRKEAEEVWKEKKRRRAKTTPTPQVKGKKQKSGRKLQEAGEEESSEGEGGEEEAKFVMYDSRFQTLLRPYGPPGTFMGGFGNAVASPTKTIDFVFVDPGTTVVQHAVLTDSVEELLLSDHRPVLVDVLFFDPLERYGIHVTEEGAEKPERGSEGSEEVGEVGGIGGIGEKEQGKGEPDEGFYSKEEVERMARLGKKKCEEGFSRNQVIGIVALALLLNSKQQSIRSWIQSFFSGRVMWLKTRRRSKQQHFL